MRPLAVVIPSRTASNFRHSAAAVNRNEPDAQVILVDDGIEERPALRFTTIQGVKPFCFSRNMNLGINLAQESDIVLLNDDAVLETPGGLTLMQQAIERRPEYGLIAATTNNVGNRNQLPQNIGFRNEPRMCCFVCVLIPRRTIERVGLLDERYTGYGFEDDDYCLRVRQAGLKIAIHDAVFCDHKLLPSTFRSGNYPRELFDRNQELFRLKHGAPNHAL